MVNKDFCLSSYIAYRYICYEGIEFANGLKHVNFKPLPDSQRIKVGSAQEMNADIESQIDSLYGKYNSIGVLLSGGMDSAIVASYLHPGSHAYTFTTSQSGVFDADIERAKRYCEKLGLVHHLIDINFDDYKQYTPIVMKRKCAPVHSIEPQIYKAAMAAKADGAELVLVGESADLIFGGMDQLISRDWNYDDFVKRYTFLEPERVLSNPDMSVYGLYEKYRQPEDKIDYMTFMDEVFSVESSGSYWNAFGEAGLPYYDPYARMIMRDALDLNRVRNGEPKYLVRELFALRYPDLEIPFKIPMPRPVEAIFKDWSGPTRPEFRSDIEMNALTGNQKWQLWCSEKFLNMLD